MLVQLQLVRGTLSLPVCLTDTLYMPGHMMHCRFEVRFVTNDDENEPETLHVRSLVIFNLPLVHYIIMTSYPLFYRNPLSLSR